jgi:hypothetical protein
MSPVNLRRNTSSSSSYFRSHNASASIDKTANAPPLVESAQETVGQQVTPFSAEGAIVDGKQV